jgi:hypothetical protein
MLTPKSNAQVGDFWIQHDGWTSASQVNHQIKSVVRAMRAMAHDPEAFAMPPACGITGPTPSPVPQTPIVDGRQTNSPEVGERQFCLQPSIACTASAANGPYRGEFYTFAARVLAGVMVAFRKSHRLQASRALSSYFRVPRRFYPG